MPLGLHEWVRIAGIVLFSIGLMCFPFALGANPKADQSAFNQMASLGAFTYAAAPCLIGGTLLFLGSFLKRPKK